MKDETRFDLFDRIFKAYADGLDGEVRALELLLHLDRAVALAADLVADPVDPEIRAEEHTDAADDGRRDEAGVGVAQRVLVEERVVRDRAGAVEQGKRDER